MLALTRAIADHMNEKIVQSPSRRLGPVIITEYLLSSPLTVVVTLNNGHTYMFTSRSVAFESRENDETTDKIFLRDTHEDDEYLTELFLDRTGNNWASPTATYSASAGESVPVLEYWIRRDNLVR